MATKKGVKAFLFLGLICVFALSACKKDPQATIQPALPPMESIQMMDLSNLGADAKKASYLHVRSAKAVLAVWHSILTVDFAWQLAAYKLVASQTAVKVEENKWTWTYQVELDGVESNIVITGSFIGQTAQWVMTIDNVKRLEGTSSADKSKGSWSFYKNKTIPYMSVDWAYIASDHTGIVTYKNVNSSDVDRDSYLSITLTNANDYDATFKSYQKSIGLSAEIQWSRKNKVGAYKANGSGWLYWNNMYIDE